MNRFQQIADALNAAADALEQRCTCPSGSQYRGDLHAEDCPARKPGFEHHWSLHFRSDAKSMQLLAESSRAEQVPT